MDLVLSVIIFLAFLGAIGLGLRFLVPMIADHVRGSFGSASGWDTLLRHYATAAGPEGEILKRQSLVVGSVVYRYIVTAGIGETGLYLAVGGPLPRRPVLIPWDAFKRASPVRLFWQKAALVTLGDPEVGTLTLPMTLYDKMRPHLPPQLASFGSAESP
jgi:hypothetical protein